MKKFLDENFLLRNETARILYHEYAADMPIIDYHNHLPPDQIANDTRFENLTKAWLYGDHYKWRAMRINGVAEKYCTGDADDFEKFEQWAATVPFTVRNPLYHWTHLELQRYFGINDLLEPSSAKRIYGECYSKLNSPEYSVQNLLRKANVKWLCTTDDPVDGLEHHRKVSHDGYDIGVFPAFRPDKAMQSHDPVIFNSYANKLEEVTNISISSFDDYLTALKSRHDFFSAAGCFVSDHGLDFFYADDYTESEITECFNQLRTGNIPDPLDQRKFKSALLEIFAIWDWEKGWVQQYHVGALRNNNSRLLKELGPDTGWDSIGDYPQAQSMSRFLDRLDKQNKLTKTILYNLNPADNAMMAAMTGNFNDGSVAGKVQWGSAWWFLDQKDGMTDQMNTLSNMSLISRFVGMLTDSRSFLSYPRHEYFRRILCNLFGEDMENGEIPNDEKWIGKMIQDICYNNAAAYFNRD